MATQTKILKVALLHKDAKLPEKGYEGDAGFDLYAMAKARIPGGKKAKIPTGIAVAIPKGFYGQVLERGSVSINTDLFVKAGVVDEGYRGEIFLVMANHSQWPHTVEKGTKLAQLAILPVPKIKIEQVNLEDLQPTERGTKNLGSTDTKPKDGN